MYIILHHLIKTYDFILSKPMTPCGSDAYTSSRQPLLITLIGQNSHSVNTMTDNLLYHPRGLQVSNLLPHGNKDHKSHLEFFAKSSASRSLRVKTYAYGEDLIRAFKWLQ